MKNSSNKTQKFHFKFFSFFCFVGGPAQLEASLIASMKLINTRQG